MASLEVPLSRRIRNYFSWRVSQIDPRPRVQCTRLKRKLPSHHDRVSEVQTDDDYLLVILDACRFDTFASIYTDYLHGDLEKTYTTARNTFEYTALNWCDNTYDVDYVTAAPPIHTVDYTDPEESMIGLERDDDELGNLYGGRVPANHIERIHEAWQHWNDRYGVCPPHVVTDTALQVAEESSRVVAHYFQPHAPYIGDPEIIGQPAGNQDARKAVADGGILDRLRAGNITPEELRAAYRGNLEVVLPEVVKLIHETEFDRVVVTSDHGEALGEYRCWWHVGMTHPKVQVVPWLEVTGVVEDRLEEVTESRSQERTAAAVTDRLGDLGYI